MWGQIEFILPSPTSSPLQLATQAVWQTHAPTFNKWRQRKKKKKKNNNNNNNKSKKVALHMLTHDAMWGCGLTSLMVCSNDKLHDIRKHNVTIRSEIWTTNICSLGFRDTREYVTLWRLILRSLGCTLCPENKAGPKQQHTWATSDTNWSFPHLFSRCICYSSFDHILCSHLTWLRFYLSYIIRQRVKSNTLATWVDCAETCWIVASLILWRFNL